MKTAWLQIVGVGVIAASTGIAAQSPQSTTSREVISATGCVQRAGADDTGEGIGPGFVLAGIRVAPASGLIEATQTPARPATDERSIATTGADATGAAARVQPTGEAPPATRAGMLLVADRGIDLAEHVGHRVLVTGRLSSFAAPGGVASTASGRTLTVTQVSLISAACTTGS